jgi:hypothetical protein
MLMSFIGSGKKYGDRKTKGTDRRGDTVPDCQQTRTGVQARLAAAD